MINLREKARLLKVLGAESADAAAPDAAEQARLRAGHRPPAARGAAPAGLAAAVEPPREGGAAGRGDGAAHAAVAAVAGEAPADLPADGRDPPAIGGPLPRRGGPGPRRRTAQGTVPPDADRRRRARPRSAAGSRGSPAWPQQYEAAKRELSAGNLRLVVSDRQTLPQPRPELPGPDSGREHGPDAGGRQVRVRPRLQVLDLRHLVDSPGDHPRHRRPQPHHPRARST